VLVLVDVLVLDRRGEEWKEPAQRPPAQRQFCPAITGEASEHVHEHDDEHDGMKMGVGVLRRRPHTPDRVPILAIGPGGGYDGRPPQFLGGG